MVVVVLGIVALVWVFGRDEGGPSYRGPANDPVTALCRSASDQGSAACAASFFACREGRAKIVEDAQLPRTARPREIAIAYVHDAWSDWDAAVRDAAQRGCRKGLAG